jgi:ankyrin repeat protein
MYPNPQDVVPLPTRPDFDRYATQANDLSAACKARGRDGVRAWAEQWIDKQGCIDAFTDFAWNQFSAGRGCAVTDARFLIARAYGFLSWSEFAQHIQALQLTDAPITAFETAADAIVDGDVVTLERLLRGDPSLVHARSTREHGAALLHYVAANGVENYRQKTPKNIVEIAEVLLKAGAEVDATANMYGGNATTLGLAATSIYPLKAEVQTSLLDLLLNHGADMDRPSGAGRNVSIVNGCLANGRGEAAEYLASRGARLDLESASGVGRLDIVKGFFNGDGTLTPNATPAQMRDGFAWACQYGRTPVVAFLLDHGIGVAGNLGRETGLHWAAFGAHLDLVQLLLSRHAPVDVIDERWEATPLMWALHAWGNEPRVPPERYYAVVQMLVAAGATVKPEWLEHPAIHADAKMLAALNERNQHGA